MPPLWSVTPTIISHIFVLPGYSVIKRKRQAFLRLPLLDEICDWLYTENQTISVAA